jgi:hypothetical protein
MNRTLKATAVAVALASVALFGTARAAEVVFDPGSVAYGYKDGYWTRSHEWHKWEKPEHVQVFRARPNAEYHEWAHDRDADLGWHEVK